MKRVKDMILFANGMIAAFDEDGEQIPELQGNAVQLWAELAVSKGYSVNSCYFATQGIHTTHTSGNIEFIDGEVKLKWT